MLTCRPSCPNRNREKSSALDTNWNLFEYIVEKKDLQCHCIPIRLILIYIRPNLFWRRASFCHSTSFRSNRTSSRLRFIFNLINFCFWLGVKTVSDWNFHYEAHVFFSSLESLVFLYAVNYFTKTKTVSNLKLDFYKQTSLSLTKTIKSFVFLSRKHKQT